MPSAVMATETLSQAMKQDCEEVSRQNECRDPGSWEGSGGGDNQIDLHRFCAGVIRYSFELTAESWDIESNDELLGMTGEPLDISKQPNGKLFL